MIMVLVASRNSNFTQTSSINWVNEETLAGLVKYLEALCQFDFVSPMEFDGDRLFFKLFDFASSLMGENCSYWFSFESCSQRSLLDCLNENNAD